MRAVVVVGLALGLAAPARAQGIAPETARGPTLATPTLPAFELPVYEAGVVSPRALHVGATSSSTVTVRGYVVAKTKSSFTLADTRKGRPLVTVEGTATTKVGAYVTVTGTYDDGIIALDTLTAATGKPTLEPVVSPAPAGTLAVPAAKRVGDAGKRQLAEATYEQCVKLYGAGKYVEAGQRCEAASRTWAGHANAYYMGAAAYVAVQQWSDAQALIAQGLMYLPTQPMFRMLAGYIGYESDSLEAAERELVIAIQLEPDLWRAHYYLSLVHAKRGFDSAAASELTTAISHGPRDPMPYRALVALYSRWAYFDEAATVARLAIEVLPTTADLHYDLGRALEAGGDDKGAIKAFTELLKVSQNDPRGLFGRGCAYHRQKQKQKAKSDLESFLVMADGSRPAEEAAATQLLDALK